MHVTGILHRDDDPLVSLHWCHSISATPSVPSKLMFANDMNGQCYPSCLDLTGATMMAMVVMQEATRGMTHIPMMPQTND